MILRMENFTETLLWVTLNHSAVDDATNESGFNKSAPFDGGWEDLSLPYALFEILVAICAICGNAAVIIVFQQEKRLRRRTNYYIVSLAMADFLVGLLGIPFAIMASVGLPRNLHACLVTVSILMVLCTISIFCLVAVSVDRYWAILHPMAYSRNVSTKTAITMVSLCWIAGSFIGFLPLFGWHAAKGEDQACLFVEVMDYSYLVFLYFATIITPGILLACFYAHIYSVIIRQMKTTVTMSFKSNANGSKTKIREMRRQRGGTMLRVLGAAQKREVKATQNLSIIVLFFMICWMPLYTINCINAFCNKCMNNLILTNFCIILSHLNSALNPLLYAYHLKDFRKALKTAIMRLCGMKIPPEPETHRLSLVNKNIFSTGGFERDASSSQQRVRLGSNTHFQPRNSPSPGKRLSTHLSAPSVVNLTVDTRCKIWQIIHQDSASPSLSPPSPKINTETSSSYPALQQCSVDSRDSTKGIFVEYYSSASDQLFMPTMDVNGSTRKLLFSTHIRRDFSIDEGIAETAPDATSRAEPSQILTTESVLCIPNIENDVSVKISRASQTDFQSNWNSEELDETQKL